MKLRLVSVVALAMTTTAGISNAQDNMGSDLNQPAIQSPETDAFTPMTRSERFKHYLVSTFGRKALASGAMRAELGQVRHDPKEFGAHGAAGERLTAERAD